MVNLTVGFLTTNATKHMADGDGKNGLQTATERMTTYIVITFNKSL